MPKPSRKSPAAKPQRELLKIDGQSVEVMLRHNPRARRLIVKVHPTSGEVTVVAPSRAGLARAMEFARGHSAWIARQLAHVPGRVLLAPGNHVPWRGADHLIRLDPCGSSPVSIAEGARHILVSGRSEHAPRRIGDFMKKEARRIFAARVAELAPRLNVKPSRITVRDTASRWGSCSSTRSLSFSWRLVLAPPFVLDYVVAHELAHIREMNHGPRFWMLVDTVIADRGRAQRWLRDHGMALHRFATKA